LISEFQSTAGRLTKVEAHPVVPTGNKLSHCCHRRIHRPSRGGIALEINARQVDARTERTPFDGDDAVGDDYAVQATARRERPIPNGHEIVENIHVGEACAIGEGIASNGRHAAGMV